MGKLQHRRLCPEEYGDYFAWGETEPHYAEGHSQDSPCSDWRNGYNGYDWDNYKWGKDAKRLKKYVDNPAYGPVDNKTELDDEDDVAEKFLGGDWRMPTEAEWKELKDNCKWKWTKVNGVNGYKVTSKKKGYTNKSIFLPAAGYRDDADLKSADSYGDYWSRSLNTDYSDYARNLNFNSGYVYAGDDFRNFGQSVRAVQRK